MNNNDEQKYDLDIPSFLRRDGAESESPVEAPPTLEQLLDTIRKLSAKRDGITENIRILKKQTQAMIGKL
jgi:hypothetical protein